MITAKTACQRSSGRLRRFASGTLSGLVLTGLSTWGVPQAVMTIADEAIYSDEAIVHTLEGIFEISMADYQKTIDMWLKNVFDHRERMKALAGESFYKDYRAYLKAARRFMASEVYLLDIVTSRKIAETLRR